MTKIRARKVEIVLVDSNVLATSDGINFESDHFCELWLRAEVESRSDLELE